jgi:hypothetical protein
LCSLECVSTFLRFCYVVSWMTSRCGTRTRDVGEDNVYLLDITKTGCSMLESSARSSRICQTRVHLLTIHPSEPRHSGPPTASPRSSFCHLLPPSPLTQRRSRPPLHPPRHLPRPPSSSHPSKSPLRWQRWFWCGNGLRA